MPTASMPIINVQPVAPSASEMASMARIMVTGSASSPPYASGAANRNSPARAIAETTSDDGRRLRSASSACARTKGRSDRATPTTSMFADATTGVGPTRLTTWILSRFTGQPYPG